MYFASGQASLYVSAVRCACSRSMRIQQAKRQWASGAFPQVPGETEVIPLPER